MRYGILGSRQTSFLNRPEQKESETIWTLQVHILQLQNKNEKTLYTIHTSTFFSARKGFQEA